MKTSTKVLSVGLACSLVTNFVITSKLSDAKPQKQLKNAQEKVIDNNTMKFSYDDIIEVNRNLCNVIVHESKPTKFIAQASSGDIFTRQANVSMSYSYNATLDVSSVKPIKVGDKYLMTFKLSDVKLHDINISEPKVTNDLNMVSGLFGKDVSRLNSTLIAQSYEEIEDIVQDDFNTLDTSDIQNKLEKIYNGLPIVVQVIKE